MKKKIYYKLFWEYLKRSEDYEDYCIWRQQIKKNSENPLPQKLREFRVHFKPLYDLLGNIHSESFEEWWKYNKSLFEVRKRIRVRDFKKVMGSTFDRAMAQHKVKMNGKRSVQKVKQYLVDYLISSPERALVAIDLWGQETSKELGEQVSKIISPLRKNEKVRAYSLFFNFLNRQPIPGAIKKPKSHFRYFKIYDMRYPGYGKKGLTVEEIAKRYYPQEEGKKEVSNPERIINEILALVKDNIKNVDHGKSLSG